MRTPSSFANRDPSVALLSSLVGPLSALVDASVGAGLVPARAKEFVRAGLVPARAKECVGAGLVPARAKEFVRAGLVPARACSPDGAIANAKTSARPKK